MQLQALRIHQETKRRHRLKTAEIQTECDALQVEADTSAAAQVLAQNKITELMMRIAELETANRRFPQLESAVTTTGKSSEPSCTLGFPEANPVSLVTAQVHTGLLPPCPVFDEESDEELIWNGKEWTVN